MLTQQRLVASPAVVTSGAVFGARAVFGIRREKLLLHLWAVVSGKTDTQLTLRNVTAGKRLKKAIFGD